MKVPMQSTPVLVSSLSNIPIQRISSGWWHAIAITSKQIEPSNSDDSNLDLSVKNTHPKRISNLFIPKEFSPRLIKIGGSSSTLEDSRIKQASVHVPRKLEGNDNVGNHSSPINPRGRANSATAEIARKL
jgi:hypothetical protein